MNNLPFKIKTDFNKDRSNTIGASDIVVITGNSGYKTVRDLYEIKKEIKKDSAGRKALWGNLHESNILLEFLSLAYKKNVPYFNFNAGWKKTKIESSDYEFFRYSEFIHPQYPYMKVHPDMIAVDAENKTIRYNVQAKSHSIGGFKRSEGKLNGYDREDMSASGLSIGTYLQIQYEMLVISEACKAHGWEFDSISYVPVLADTNNLYIYGSNRTPIIDDTGNRTGYDYSFPGIKSNAKHQERCLAAAINFKKCLDKSTPPEPNNNDLAAVDVMPDSILTVAGEQLQKVMKIKSQYKKIKKLESQVKVKKDDLTASVKMLMGYYIGIIERLAIVEIFHDKIPSKFFKNPESRKYLIFKSMKLADFEYKRLKKDTDDDFNNKSEQLDKLRLLWNETKNVRLDKLVVNNIIRSPEGEDLAKATLSKSSLKSSISVAEISRLQKDDIEFFNQLKERGYIVQGTESVKISF